MNVLWVVNIITPEAGLLTGEKSVPFGGWIVSSAHQLSNEIGVNLIIAFPTGKSFNSKVFKGEKIQYRPFKRVKSHRSNLHNNNELETILIDSKPDLVNIFGTELPHCLLTVNLCNKLGIKHIITLQGLVSVLSKHMYANLPYRVIYGATLRNIILKDSVYFHKKTLIARGRFEIESIKRSKYIIGRTPFDKEISTRINRGIRYFECNETLRSSFYEKKWSLDTCERFSIFMSQGHYSLKGLHYALEALEEICKVFPNAVLYIAGKNITNTKTFMDKMLLTRYGIYIKKLIKKYRIQSNVIFLGNLSEINMRDRMIKSHVVISASTIENSPNSLCEALLMGLPTVSSFVGGVPSIVKHGEEGFLYPYDEPYMLSHYIKLIFSNDELARRLSKNAAVRASITHSITENRDSLMNIYSEIL